MRLHNDIPAIAGNVTVTPARISAKGLGHILNNLASAYRDPEAGALREYAANARDSHVQAGQSLPVRIGLPSDLDPTLTITDFGVGLHRHELIDTFAVFGESTKQDNDDAIGAIGIGAKSGYAIGHQFLVTARKDGIETIGIFTRTDDGAPGHAILDSTPTTEHDGVKIEIAVTNPARVAEVAPGVFRGWPKGSVLINGVEPDDTLGDPIIPGVWPNRAGGRTHRASTVMVRYGVTLYAVDHLLNSTHREALLGLTIDVPLGDLDVPLSRDEIKDTPRGRANLAALATRYIATLTAHAEGILDTHDGIVAAKLLDPRIRPFTQAWNARHLSDKTSENRSAAPHFARSKGTRGAWDTGWAVGHATLSSATVVITTDGLRLPRINAWADTNEPTSVIVARPGTPLIPGRGLTAVAGAHPDFITSEDYFAAMPAREDGTAGPVARGRNMLYPVRHPDGTIEDVAAADLHTLTDALWLDGTNQRFTDVPEACDRPVIEINRSRKPHVAADWLGYKPTPFTSWMVDHRITVVLALTDAQRADALLTLAEWSHHSRARIHTVPSDSTDDALNAVARMRDLAATAEPTPNEAGTHIAAAYRYDHALRSRLVKALRKSLDLPKSGFLTSHEAGQKYHILREIDLWHTRPDAPVITAYRAAVAAFITATNAPAVVSGR